jgi:hypothetical protein
MAGKPHNQWLYHYSIKLEKWSTGVLEYWSIGKYVLYQDQFLKENNPTLHYSTDKLNMFGRTINILELR